MKTFLYLLPAVLSALTLAAHHLRRGDGFGTIAWLAMLWLLGVRERYSRRLLQVVLAAGAFEWARTLAELASERRAAGEPAGRLVAILASVAAVTLLSALLLETPTLRRRFTPPPPAVPSPGAPIA